MVNKNKWTTKFNNHFNLEINKIWKALNSNHKICKTFKINNNNKFKINHNINRICNYIINNNFNSLNLWCHNKILLKWWIPINKTKCISNIIANIINRCHLHTQAIKCHHLSKWVPYLNNLQWHLDLFYNSLLWVECLNKEVMLINWQLMLISTSKLNYAPLWWLITFVLKCQIVLLLIAQRSWEYSQT